MIVAHKHDTTLYVMAESEDCIPRRDALVSRIPPPRTTSEGQYGRRVVAIGPDGLGPIPTAESWCLAVLVCPGDRMERLIAWARGGLEAPHLARIRFYVQPSHDPFEALASWTSDVAPTADVSQPANENALMRLVLFHLNGQIYADFAPGKPPGVP